MPKPSVDVHQAVTDQIIAVLEAGAGEARLPWQRTGASSILPRNAASKQAYNGINVVALWAACEQRGFTRSLWGTYRQWQSLDAQVRKGEKASLVVFYKQLDVEPEGDDDDGKRHFARASWVFNVAQVDGFVDDTVLEPLPAIVRNARAEAVVAATGADIRVSGEAAYYRRDSDHIQMPDENLFREPDSGLRTQDWYSVLLHELGHWSGAKARLDREFGKRFGDDAYAMEELVAELAAAFLCADLTITPAPRADHAGYIAHWLKVLKSDKRAIFTAAAKASEAAKFIAGFASKEDRHAA